MSTKSKRYTIEELNRLSETAPDFCWHAGGRHGERGELNWKMFVIWLDLQERKSEILNSQTKEVSRTL